MKPQNFTYQLPKREYIFQEDSYEKQIEKASSMIKRANAVLIGIGAGMSAAAGLCYDGERFRKNFLDFIEKYGERNMTDMYSAGFYPYPSEEAKWGYWSRHVCLNLMDPEGLPLYQTLYQLVKDKDYFIISTNVDSQPEKVGFAKKRIFEVQGNYGEIQCQKGCHNKVYQPTSMFQRMVCACHDCLVPSDMVPKCPVCGGPMTMHLRVDHHFIEDQSWIDSAKRYQNYRSIHREQYVVLLELGVGFNTPGIIRFPFEQMIERNKRWSLVRFNLDEAVIPRDLCDRAVGINDDISKSLTDIEKRVNRL